MVIDADALTALKDHTELLAQMQVPKVLTPHAGEMARLTGLTVEEINRDRLNISRKYALSWQAVVVLKGAPTVVASPNGTVYVNSTGTKALATGGSGDVLSGIIGGLLAQGMEPLEAARLGVFLHGKAGDKAAEKYGAYSMTATSLLEGIGEVTKNR